MRSSDDMGPVTWAQAMCDDRRVHHRALTIVLCLILAMVKTSGVHAHLFLDHAHDGFGDVHQTIETVDEHDAGHVEAHLKHGSVDADVPAKSAKLAWLSVSVAIVACFLLLFVSAVAPSLPGFPGGDAPPKWRKRSYLIPPSQAPPVALA